MEGRELKMALGRRLPPHTGRRLCSHPQLTLVGASCRIRCNSTPGFRYMVCAGFPWPALDRAALGASRSP
jgi:hypothetical protein